MSSDLEQPAEAGTAFSRRTLLHGAAWAVPVVAVAVAGAPAMAASPGCLPDGTLMDSIARAKFLGGSLLDSGTGSGGVGNLDGLVDLNGVTAKALRNNEGSEIVEVVRKRPLNVEVLNALQLELGGVQSALGSILNFAVPTSVGALNEYALANQNGDIRAASGAVTEDGVVSFNPGNEDGTPMATLDLLQVLNDTRLRDLPVVDSLLTVLDPTVATVAPELKLQIGAVAGEVEFNSLCFPPEDLQREYLLAYLRLLVESDLVGDILTALSHDNLAAVTLDTQQIFNLLSNVPVLGGVLSALGGVLGVDQILKAEIVVDTSKTISNEIIAKIDNDDVLTLLLAESRILLDVGPLLGNPGGSPGGLNNLSANTRLFTDAALPTDRVQDLLGSLTDAILHALADIISIKITSDVNVLGLAALNLNIDVTLAKLLGLQGAADPVISVTARLGIVQQTIDVGALTSAILGTDEQSGLLPIVRSALFAPDGLLGTALSGLNTLLAALFEVLTQVIVITVNAQNNPKPETAWIPSDLATLTGEKIARYDVAALHVGAVGLVDVLDVFLARASGGENYSRQLPQIIF